MCTMMRMLDYNADGDDNDAEDDDSELILKMMILKMTMMNTNGNS